MNRSSSPYARQLKGGFPFLRFSRDMEREFRESYGSLVIPRIRIALLIAILIIVFYEMIDRAFLPSERLFWTSLIRFGILFPVMVLSWALTFVKSFHRRIVNFILVPALVAGLGIMVILVISYGYGPDARYHSLILATTIVYFLSGLLFRTSLAYLCAVMAFYITGAIIAGADTSILLSRSVFLFWMNLIGASGCYLIERATRVNFLQRRILQEISERDGLTGIYNRLAFDTTLARLWGQAVRDRKSLALLMTDVDHFKLYNDAHGHLEGDECLKSIARTMEGYARRPFDSASRYGGEEFALLWYDAEESFVREMAERFREAVQSLGILHATSPVSDVITVSAGCALIVPGPDEGPEKLIRVADEALYRAKEEGRNRVVFFIAPALSRR
ncbi:MAG: GGDEF domain-containing protein [Spirochaetes bacterium]|nr:GGDEF domain-containing protein [Spirochaetota bacterium]